MQGTWGEVGVMAVGYRCRWGRRRRQQEGVCEAGEGGIGRAGDYDAA